MEQYTSHRTKNGRLPQGLTPLVGREAEIADARRLLADPDCRLLTLVGPGGIGKTRLAVEVATRQRDHFRDGIHFIDLLSVESTDFLIPVIADALQFPIRGSADSQEQLLSYLKERQALLVLDNFEHLLEGVQLVSEILRAAPGVKLMATSREVLRRTFSDNGNQLRSIVATTDVRAQVLYLKAGVYPRFPIYYFGRQPEKVRVETDLVFEPLVISPKTLAIIRELDKTTLGFWRDVDHE